MTANALKKDKNTQKTQGALTPKQTITTATATTTAAATTTTTTGQWWWWLFPRVREFWENVRPFIPCPRFFFFFFF